MKKNIGEKERTVRIVFGMAILVAAALGVVSGAAAMVMAIVGAVLTITGLLNHCPLYAAMGCCNMKECTADKDKKEEEVKKDAS